MPGGNFTLGQPQTRPGIYVNTTNVGAQPTPQTGVVAAVFAATWGPLGVVATLNDFNAVAQTFLSGGTTMCPTEVFLGGAQQVLAYRLTGAGNAKATYAVKDTAAATIATLTAKYDGTGGNGVNVTIRVNLTDATKHDLLVYNGTQLVETWTYAFGTDEAAAIVTALAASTWLTAVKVIIGAGVAALITNQTLAGGVDPTPAGADYTTAFNALETYNWNVLVTDAESTTIHASLRSYIDRVRSQDGARVIGVVGEPTAVSLATRQTDALAHNDYAIVYVGNGFTRADLNGNTLTQEGYKAASRVAGMIAALPIPGGLTYAQLPDATGIVGPLVNSDVVNCITNGMLVFTYSPSRQTQVEYGITTLTATGNGLDAGFKKIRRVRTRDFLIASIIAQWAPLIGHVNNNATGQAALIAQANQVINGLIARQALSGGLCYLDPGNAPAGDACYFIVQVDDTDSAEHIYLTAGFEFSPSAQ